jgi:hypothetical protein
MFERAGDVIEDRVEQPLRKAMGSLSLLGTGKGKGKEKEAYPERPTGYLSDVDEDSEEG